MINQYLNRKNKYKEREETFKKKKALNKNTSQRIDIISIREIEWIDTE